MRPITQTVFGIGTSNPITVDHHLVPFSVGFGCIISGTATYSVQHSYDGTNWFNSAVNAAIANAEGSYTIPNQFIRLNVTASTGSVTITLIQAGER